MGQTDSGRKMHFWMKKTLIAFGAYTLCGTSAAMIYIPDPAAANAASSISRSHSKSDSQKENIIRSLTEKLQRTVDWQERIEGQDPAITIALRLDINDEKTLVIDLGRGYIPFYWDEEKRGDYMGSDLEDLLDEVVQQATESLRGRIHINAVVTEFDGKDLDFYYGSPATVNRKPRPT